MDLVYVQKECRLFMTVDGKRPMRVLLADDHTMFREGLADVLASSYAEEVEVVEKTDTGEEAVALAQKVRPDVVIMEVDEDPQKAKETLSQILLVGSTRTLKVIILTMFEDPPIIREIMELGANAYIHKSASVEELFAILRTTALDTEGKHTIVALPQQAHKLSEDGLGKDGTRRALTRRELEILLLAAHGMSNRQIASHLGIVEGTAKRHLPPG
jgi:DNA-binding NarL/FixJ family response regulator